MSKRKKRMVIILIILTVIYFLLIGASYIFIKLFIAPAFEPGNRVTVAYPYSNAAIPDDFAERSAAGQYAGAHHALASRCDQHAAEIALMRVWLPLGEPVFYHFFGNAFHLSFFSEIRKS